MSDPIQPSPDSPSPQLQDANREMRADIHSAKVDLYNIAHDIGIIRSWVRFFGVVTIISAILWVILIGLPIWKDENRRLQERSWQQP